MPNYIDDYCLDMTTASNMSDEVRRSGLARHLKQVVADLREYFQVPDGDPLVLKVGGASRDRWRDRASSAAHYPHGLFELTKFEVATGADTKASGAALEAECIALMRDMPGVLCINVRLAVSEYEHRNASPTRPSSVYINVVRRELQIHSSTQWQAQWAAHQLTNRAALPLRLLGLDAYAQATSKYHTGTSKFHTGEDAYSQATSKYHTGEDAVSLGTAKPQPSGADRKQHSYPASRIYGLDLEALQRAWDEGGPDMPYSLQEMFSAGRTRFNTYLGDIRESSSKLEKLIDSNVCGGSLSTGKFKELRNAFIAAQAEAGTDAADDTQPPPRKKAMLAPPPPRKQEDKEEGEEEEAGVYLLSTSQLPRHLLVFAPIRADATWEEIVAKYSKCFDEHVSKAVWESGGVRTLVFDDVSLAAAKAAFMAAADDSTSMALRSWSDAESRAAEVDVD